MILVHTGDPPLDEADMSGRGPKLAVGDELGLDGLDDRPRVLWLMLRDVAVCA